MTVRALQPVATPDITNPEEFILEMINLSCGFRITPIFGSEMSADDMVAIFNAAGLMPEALFIHANNGLRKPDLFAYWDVEQGFQSSVIIAPGEVVAFSTTRHQFLNLQKIGVSL